MHDLDTLLNKNTFEVKIFNIQGYVQLPLHGRCEPLGLGPVATVCDVELVAVSPSWIALLNLSTFVGHMSAQKVTFYHVGNRTVFDESGQHFTGSPR